jgi:hypothetical protein
VLDEQKKPIRDSQQRMIYIMFKQMDKIQELDTLKKETFKKLLIMKQKKQEMADTK